VAIRGFLEFSSATVVRGWAYDPEKPAAVLEVIVRVADEFVASGRADIRRSDLAAAGIGDGTHGFNIDLTGARIAADAVPALEAHAVSGDQTVKLPRTQGRSNQIADLISDAGQPITDEVQFPVFVLGPARSGTSVVTLGLLSSGRYEGTGEGHLLPLAHALLGRVDSYYQHRAGSSSETLLSRVPVQAFHQLVRRSFVHLARDLFPTGYWLDKTPTVEMVRAAPLMRELWPNARFIFMKRRVIENVLSRRRRFPHDSAQMHYSDWAAVMAAWLDVRDRLAGAALEVEHRQLVLEPHAALSAIGKLLELPDQAAARFREFVAGNRPEQTDANFGATYTLENLHLKADEARHMVETCDRLMAAYGYSYRESYFAHYSSAASQPSLGSDVIAGG
jgi:sulfotransferase family protein